MISILLLISHLVNVKDTVQHLHSSIPLRKTPRLLLLMCEYMHTQSESEIEGIKSVHGQQQEVRSGTLNYQVLNYQSNIYTEIDLLTLKPKCGETLK